MIWTLPYINPKSILLTMLASCYGIYQNLIDQALLFHQPTPPPKELFLLYNNPPDFGDILLSDRKLNYSYNT